MPPQAIMAASEATKFPPLPDHIKNASKLQRLKLQHLPVDIILRITAMLGDDALEFRSDWDSNDLTAGYKEPWESAWEVWYYSPFTPQSEGRWYTYSRFAVWPSLLNLAATCHRVYDIVTPAIYKSDVLHSSSSALLISARKGSLLAVQWSVRLGGADVNQTDNTLYTEEQMDNVNRYQVSATRCTPTTTSFTALHWATIFGHEDIVKFLLEQPGINVNQRVVDSNLKVRGDDVYDAATRDARRAPAWTRPTRTIIREVSVHHQTPATNLLARNMKRRYLGNDDLGVNALYFALDTRVQEWVPAFQEARPFGDDTWLRPWGGPNIPAKYTLNTRQVLAARTRIAKMLIDAGSSLRTHAFTREPLGVHALHQAVSECNLEIFNFLVKEKGVDAKLRDIKGRFPECYIPTMAEAANEHGSFGKRMRMRELLRSFDSEAMELGGDLSVPW